MNDREMSYREQDFIRSEEGPEVEPSPRLKLEIKLAKEKLDRGYDNLKARFDKDFRDLNQTKISEWNELLKKNLSFRGAVAGHRQSLILYSRQLEAAGSGFREEWEQVIQQIRKLGRIIGASTMTRGER